MSIFLKNLISFLTSLDKNIKSFIVIILDITIIFFAWFVFVILPAIFVTEFRYTLSEYLLQIYSLSFTFPLVIYLIFMILLNGYREIFRSFTLNNIYPVLISSSAFFVSMVVVNMFVLNIDSFFTALLQGFSVSASAFLFIILSRITFRTMSAISINKSKRNIYLYGSGNSARELFSSLSLDDSISVKAFITDDSSITGRELYSTKVISLNSAKKEWKNNNQCSLFIASRSITDERKNEIISLCESLGVEVRKISSYGEMLKEKEISLTDLTISDLLPRNNLDDFNNEIDVLQNKSIVITGAGGSIGSELARALIKGGVKEIMLIDISESALFVISEELKHISKSAKIRSVLLSVKNKNKLSDIFKKYRPDYVYHAAAYKHVPILEEDDNYSQAFKNNFLGTCNIADVSKLYGVSKFILVSTDKAVRPTNLMGASKRLAEIYLDSISLKSKTIFSSVRFGNVIDSSGSVVPTFRKQIRMGGPVTVTHPDIIRYFMTIGEAAYLVILASILSEEPSVYMLKMGDPVKIDDLARKLIKLSGNKVKEKDKDEGIEILYTGLRPGEKLYEELLVDEEDVKTVHPKIFVDTNRKKISESEMQKIKNEIEEYVDKNDKETLKHVLRKYADYR